MNKVLAFLTVFLFSFAFLSVLVGFIEILMLVFITGSAPSGDPKEMAELISQELVSAAMILIISPVAAMVGLIIMLFNKYRASWYFWLCLILTLPYVAFFPLGTVVFVVTWFYLLIKKHEFKSSVD